jgi:hypothetical protein
MRTPRSAAAALAVLFVCAAGVGTPSAQTAAPDTRPACVRALVAALDTIDSARARSGDPFTFAMAEGATTRDGTQIPAGTIGYGIIATASHADRGGRGGYLALETRFVELEDGRHVPIIIDRVNDTKSSAIGASANAPGLLGLIPIVGYAVGGYDSLHHGKDATISRGTRIGVFVGDDAARGTCRPPAADETPGPQPTPTPTPTPVAPASATPYAAPAPSPTPQ